MISSFIPFLTKFSWIIFLSSFLILSIYTTRHVSGDENEAQVSLRPIEEVLKENTDDLMSFAGVVGTAEGICEGRPCIKVYVIKSTLELENQIPKVLDGYQVVIEETGEFRALPEKRD